MELSTAFNPKCSCTAQNRFRCRFSLFYVAREFPHNPYTFDRNDTTDKNAMRKAKKNRFVVGMGSRVINGRDERFVVATSRTEKNPISLAFVFDIIKPLINLLAFRSVNARSNAVICTHIVSTRSPKAEDLFSPMEIQMQQQKREEKT